MYNTLFTKSVRNFYFAINSSVLGKLIITGLVAFIMAMVLLLSISTHVAAGVGENPAASNATISYESYVVQDGDTLWTIASEYKFGDYSTREFVSEIKTLNGLSKDTIHSGCYILIPVCTYNM